MPGTDTSKAFSGCLQHKIQQFVVIFSIYPLTKVITYQFSHAQIFKSRMRKFTCSRLISNICIWRSAISESLSCICSGNDCEAVGSSFMAELLLIILDKQYITVDNSLILLYTVCDKEESYETDSKRIFHGTDL